MQNPQFMQMAQSMMGGMGGGAGLMQQQPTGGLDALYGNRPLQMPRSQSAPQAAATGGASAGMGAPAAAPKDDPFASLGAW